jgi:hypothetical protein
MLKKEILETCKEILQFRLNWHAELTYELGIQVLEAREAQVREAFDAIEREISIIENSKDEKEM